MGSREGSRGLRQWGESLIHLSFRFRHSSFGTLYFVSMTPEISRPAKVLVVQPSWVGDAVMATPMLRALRELYPEAEISYLLRRYVKPVYTGMPWADRLITYRTGKT